MVWTLQWPVQNSKSFNPISYIGASTALCHVLYNLLAVVSHKSSRLPHKRHEQYYICRNKELLDATDIPPLFPLAELTI
jgi:hypothetical protein